MTDDWTTEDLLVAALTFLQDSVCPGTCGKTHEEIVAMIIEHLEEKK